MESKLIMLPAFLFIAVIGLRFLSRGLQGLFSRAHQYCLNWVSESFLSGLFWGSVSQLVTVLPVVNLLYVNSFSASGIFREKQATGYQSSAFFGYLVFALFSYLALSVNWAALLFLGGVFGFQSFFRMGRWVGWIAVGIAFYAWGLQEFLQSLSQFFVTVNTVTIFHWLADNSPLVQLGLFIVSTSLSFLLPSTSVVLIVALALRLASFVSLENFMVMVAGQIAGEALVTFLVAQPLSTVAKRLSLRYLVNTLLSAGLVFLVSHGISFGVTLEILFCLSLCWFTHIAISQIPLGRWVAEKVYPPGQKKEMQTLTFVHPLLRLAPALGVEHMQNEIRKMTAMVQTMLDLTSVLLGPSRDPGVAEKIRKYETVTDNIQNEVREYSAELMQASLSPRDAIRVRLLIRVTESLESIADHCQAISKEIRKGVEDDEKQILVGYFNRLNGVYESVFPDLTSAEFLAPIKPDESLISLKEHLEENRPLFVNSYPRLVDIYMRFLLIVSKMENITEAKRITA